MTHSLSSWASNIAPSPTLTVTAKAKALKAEGKDICSFGAGEPDFDTPEFIKEACAAALARGETKYAPVPGLPALRSALAAKYRDERGMPQVQADHVVVSPGGKFSCYLAVMAVVSPGEEVIVPAPYWVSYPEMVKLAGATPVYIEAGLEQEFKITPQQLREAITEKTRMVILNSPSNPTGAVYTKAELEALMAVAVEKGIYVMSDEIYEYLTYDGAEFVSPGSFSAEAFEHVITVGGFSKTFSMTGWRLGTLVAPAPIAKAVSSIQSQTSSNATTFAQYGALAALEQPELSRAAIAEMLQAFDRRRLMLCDGLNDIDGVSCYRSTGAFYLFPDISSFGKPSLEFCGKLLEEELVAVVPGIAFGTDACMRLSYACGEETITKGLERIKRYCAAQ